MRKSSRVRVAAVVIAFAIASVGGYAMAKTPDGVTPAEEAVCDDVGGGLYGLCNAYCEAMDCDSADHRASDRACERKLELYLERSDGVPPPCVEPPVACPCWTEEDLRGAVDAATADPDTEVDVCELFVEANQDNLFFAMLILESMDGLAVADVVSFDNSADCRVDVFDLDVGLEPIFEDISREEASECASIVGAICLDLLP